MEANIRPSKKPFVPKSSTLSITTVASPLSPRFFSFPSPGLPKSKATSPRFSTSPPLTPPAWSWSCHQCQTTYPLGATRRCLYDGHYFCAGTTVNKRTGRVKRHKPCGSVFDYVGWKEYGDWRRNEQRFAEHKLSQAQSLQAVSEDGNENASSSSNDEDAEDSDSEKLPHKRTHNCETDCNFPSECRWRPRLPKEKLKRLSPTLSEPEESKEENGMAREQEILFDLEPEPEHKADFENEPDTPMPPVDVGCRQHATETADNKNTTADTTDVPKPLRVRRKAVGSGPSSSKSKSKPKSKTKGFFSSSSPSAPSPRSSSPSSSSPPRLPELHFPSIPAPDFSLFKARLDALLAPIPPYYPSSPLTQSLEQQPRLYSPCPRRATRPLTHRALEPNSFFDFSRGDESDSDSSSTSSPSSSSDLFSRPLAHHLDADISLGMSFGTSSTAADAIAYATDPVPRPVRAALLPAAPGRHTAFAVEEDGLVLSSPESENESEMDGALVRLMRRRERERGDWMGGGGVGWDVR